MSIPPLAKLAPRSLGEGVLDDPASRAALLAALPSGLEPAPSVADPFAPRAIFSPRLVTPAASSCTPTRPLDAKWPPAEAYIDNVPEALRLRHYGLAARDSLVAPGAASFRLVVWNLEKKRDPAMERELGALVGGADLVLAQEARYGKHLRDVARPASGMRWDLAAAFRINDDPVGVLTGSRAAPLATSYLTTEGREPLVGTPKMALVSTFAMPGGGPPLLVVNVHAINFVSTATYHRQLAQLERAMATHAGPILLAGDFNTWRKSRTRELEAMTQRLGLTHVRFFDGLERRGFGRPLDHVFVRDLDVARTSVLEHVHASDHAPLVVELRPRTTGPTPAAPSPAPCLSPEAARLERRVPDLSARSVAVLQEQLASLTPRDAHAIEQRAAALVALAKGSPQRDLDDAVVRFGHLFTELARDRRLGPQGALAMLEAACTQGEALGIDPVELASTFVQLAHATERRRADLQPVIDSMLGLWQVAGDVSLRHVGAPASFDELALAYVLALKAADGHLERVEALLLGVDGRAGLLALARRSQVLAVAPIARAAAHLLAAHDGRYVYAALDDLAHAVAAAEARGGPNPQDAVRYLERWVDDRVAEMDEARRGEAG